MIQALAVAVGGGLGSLARWWVGGFMASRFGEAFPLGTLVINIFGSFIIGLFGAATMPDGPLPAGPEWRLFVMVGLCGGFTTFSAFSLQTFTLLRAGNGFAALANVLLSVGLCLAAVTLGWWLGRGG